MQDFYRCEPGVEELADRVATTACKKLMHDMHYESRLQAIINYLAWFKGRKVTKVEARNIFLTRDQYLKVNIDFF
jgi:hypothetical protein